MPRASSVSLGKYRRVGSASWWNARIDDTPPPQHQQSITYAKSSYPHDRFNSGQKTDAFDTNIASPSRQHNSTVRVSHRCIVTAAEFGRCHQRRDEIHFVGFPSLGAPAEFGRSRQVWALSPSLGALRLRYISTLLAIPEWWLGVYSWFMASCTLVRHQDKKEFGMGCRDTQLTTDESWRACVDILLSWDDELAQCAFTFTKKVAVPAAILFCGMSMVAARIFASGAPANVAFPPSPIHLLTAFNNDWLSHKYRNGSSISVSQSASKHAANLGRFELKPSSSRLCTGAFSFFPPVIISCSHFCLNRHLPLLCPETRSLRACLSLCPSGNRVLSLSIALDIWFFLLILRPLSSKLLFLRLPHGNLGEPNTTHTLRSLRIWCCSVSPSLSSALTALFLLSYPSSLLLWLLFACCGLRRFLFHRLEKGVALRLFSSTCTKPPNPSTCPSFSTTAPAPILINLPILPQ